MSDEYVWLLKGDSAYKSYLSKGWKTIISVQIESGEVFYCLSKTKQFINEEEKIQLLAPICINNHDYKDCVITFTDSPEIGFVWINKRCFSINGNMSDQFSESSMDFFHGNVIKVGSAAQLVSENTILVKSASILPIVILGICFVTLVCAGVYIWLL